MCVHVWLQMPGSPLRIYLPVLRDALCPLYFPTPMVIAGWRHRPCFLSQFLLSRVNRTANRMVLHSTSAGKKTSKPLKHCDHPSVSLPPQEKKEFKNNILKPELSPLEGQSPKPAAKTWSETSNGAGLGHVQLQKNPKPNNIQFQLSFTQYQQKEI